MPPDELDDGLPRLDDEVTPEQVALVQEWLEKVAALRTEFEREWCDGTPQWLFEWVRTTTPDGLRDAYSYLADLGFEHAQIWEFVVRFSRDAALGADTRARRRKGAMKSAEKRRKLAKNPRIRFLLSAGETPNKVAERTDVSPSYVRKVRQQMRAEKLVKPK